jgi:hypothetical protein
MPQCAVRTDFSRTRRFWINFFDSTNQFVGPKKRALLAPAQACRSRSLLERNSCLRITTESNRCETDESGLSIHRALTEEQIRELRTFDNFWIDAGALGANLGAGKPT